MNKRKYAILLIIIILIVISALVFIMFKLKNNDKKINKVNYIIEDKETISNQNVVNMTIATNSKESKTSPNTTIEFEEYYKKCKHSKKEKRKVKDNEVNLNMEQIKSMYPEWTIKTFNINNVKLYKEINRECNEHYLIKEVKNKIVIYKIENNTTNIYKETSISTECLPSVDKETLKKGIKVDGKEELNSYLENYE